MKILKYKEAKKELVKFSGFGPKIADCVLLFSLNHMEAFQIDTWIAKAMKQIYNIDFKKYDEVQCDSCGQIFRVEHS